jgi:RHS repeat-associated protein
MLGRTIAETDKEGNVTAQNIWGHKPLARKINGKYYYYLYNGHGDVVKIVDESGNIVNRYKYDEWGNILEETEEIENPIRYAGEYFDEESGMYYLRARYYDPVTGRFISKDSYEGTLTNPLSMNLYTYCYNNPLRYIDPSGHIITSWDKLHCTADEIKLLDQYTKDWENGDIAAYNYAENIRNKYRTYEEYGIGDGNTGGRMGVYDTYLYFDNARISASPEVKAIDFSIKFGTGLEANIKVAGIGVEVGGKRYYDVTNALSSNPTESLQFSVMAQATEKIKIGGNITGTVNPVTQEHLKNQGFVGVKIGNTVFGWDNLPKNQDFSLDFSAGGYFGVGGEASFNINFSEIWRRISSQF